MKSSEQVCEVLNIYNFGCRLSSQSLAKPAMQLREALIVSFAQFVSSNPLTSAKGQLIFKCPFSVFKSSKIPTKKKIHLHTKMNKNIFVFLR